MLSNLYELIANKDKFHYVPQLGFNAKRNQGTFLGGLFTIFLGVIILNFLGTELYIMASFKGYYHRSTLTVANLTEIGIVNLDDMGTLPFFSVHY